MTLRRLSKAVGYNCKETFTTSGTFTAPITGNYRITLQGGGGGGGGATDRGAGDGGGAGAPLTFYEKLIKEQVYDFVIGAGGKGGTSTESSYGGSNNTQTGKKGGASSITINSNDYIAEGGNGGFANTEWHSHNPGAGGIGKINGVAVSTGDFGQPGLLTSSVILNMSGGLGGVSVNRYGTGGPGGHISSQNAKATRYNGGNGADGCITFEWFDPEKAFPEIFKELNK